MKKAEFIEMLQPFVGEQEYVVYSVRMGSSSRRWWEKALNVILPGLQDSIRYPGMWFLVACQTEGKVIRVKVLEKQIVETLDVPHWNPSMMEEFRSITIGQRVFIRQAKERL